MRVAKSAEVSHSAVFPCGLDLVGARIANFVQVFGMDLLYNHLVLGTELTDTLAAVSAVMATVKKGEGTVTKLTIAHCNRPERCSLLCGYRAVGRGRLDPMDLSLQNSKPRSAVHHGWRAYVKRLLLREDLEGTFTLMVVIIALC